MCNFVRIAPAVSEQLCPQTAAAAAADAARLQMLTCSQKTTSHVNSPTHNARIQLQTEQAYLPYDPGSVDRGPHKRLISQHLPGTGAPYSGSNVSYYHMQPQMQGENIN